MAPPCGDPTVGAAVSSTPWELVVHQEECIEAILRLCCSSKRIDSRGGIESLPAELTTMYSLFLDMWGNTVRSAMKHTVRA